MYPVNITTSIVRHRHRIGGIACACCAGNRHKAVSIAAVDMPLIPCCIIRRDEHRSRVANNHLDRLLLCRIGDDRIEWPWWRGRSYRLK
jgi:hypothetical protein